MKNERTEAISSGQKIALFIQKYRSIFLIFIGLVTTLVIGLSVFFYVKDNLQKKAIVILEEFEKRINELGELDSAQEMEKEALLAELNAFASSTFGYAASKAFSMAADIYASRAEWSAAEDAWVKSAKQGSKTHLAPLSLFNAAVAAEEQDKLEEAISYLHQSLAHDVLFIPAQRARFNIGRLNEAKGDKDAAKEAYRDIIEKASVDSSWAKLAQSRILAIELD